MALNQFTSDWNETFDLKITVGDIKKPTQSFLFEVLDFFLSISHIDCDLLKVKVWSFSKENVLHFGIFEGYWIKVA